MSSSSEVRVDGAWKRSYARHELLTVNCPRCTSDQAHTVACEFGIAIARCDGCRLTYTQTPLTDSQGHYNTNREHVLRKYGPVFEGVASHPRDRNYDEHLAVLESMTSGRDLLDIGTHAGFFLRRAVTRGWYAIGVEPSPVTSALAREQFGLDVRTGVLSDVGLPSRSFDAVTLTDVFEHVAEPGPLLIEIRRLLRPRGVLFVKVPNVRYLHAKRRLLGWIPGVIDDCFDAREHLVHYSATTLRESLVAAGFVVEMIAVPLPIQTGGRLRRGLRAIGPALARRLPRGADLPLATDLTGLARR